MLRHFITSALATAVITVAVTPAHAEIIELLDRTKLTAKVVHYYDGVYTVDQSGKTVKIPVDKIRSITFQLPPARAELSTPQKTFERWRKALAAGEMDKVIDCYALMYQGLLANQMGHAADGIKSMQKEIEGTKFTIKDASIKGDSATLKVQRQKGEDSQTGEILFVRENGEWKMLPPQ